MTFLEHKMRFQPEFTQLFSNGINAFDLNKKTKHYKNPNDFILQVLQ